MDNNNSTNNNQENNNQINNNQINNNQENNSSEEVKIQDIGKIKIQNDKSLQASLNRINNILKILGIVVFIFGTKKFLNLFSSAKEIFGVNLDIENTVNTVNTLVKDGFEFILDIVLAIIIYIISYYLFQAGGNFKKFYKKNDETAFKKGISYLAVVTRVIIIFIVIYIAKIFIMKNI